VRTFTAIAIIGLLCSSAFAQTSLNVELAGSIVNNWQNAMNADVVGGHAYVATDAGLSVLDVQNPSSMTEVGFYSTGELFDVQVQGTYAYVSEFEYGLRVFDISDVSSPTLVGSLPLNGGLNVKGLDVVGDYVFITNGYDGLRVIDVSVPNSPAEVAFLATPWPAIDVTVAGNYAFVALSNTGLRTTDISNPVGELTEVGFCDTEGSCEGIDINGDYAYIAHRVVTNGALRVIDISDVAAPFLVGSFDLDSNANDVVYDNGLAYVAVDNEGLRIIDVSVPAVPSEVGFLDTPGQSHGLVYANGYVYFAAEASGMRTIDVSLPATPVETSRLDAGRFCGITVAGDLAYIAYKDAGMAIVDLSDVTTPQIIGQFDTAERALDVAISGNLAYIADKQDGVRVIDITDPTTPFEVGFNVESQSAREIVLANGMAYVADGFNGFLIMDLSVPTSPVVVGSIMTSQYALGVDVSGNYAYVVDSLNDIEIFDVSNPASPVFCGWFYLGGGWANDIQVRDNIAYMAYEYIDFRVADVSDPYAAVEIGFLEMESNSGHVALNGDFAFVGQGGDGVRVLDINDPTSPMELGYYDTEVLVRSVGAYGQYALVGDDNTFYVFDCTEAMEGPPEVSMSLTPPDQLTVPPGTFMYYGAQVVSNFLVPTQVDLWTEVTLPNGNIYGPLLLVSPTLGPGTVINRPELPLYIPGIAPPGSYVFHANAGDHDLSIVIDSDSFAFEVTAAAASNTGGMGWDSVDYTTYFLPADDGDAGNKVAISPPSEFALTAAYPNPFNPTTTIAVSLPEASDLTMTVFNVMGQQVATLANGKFDAGQHSFVLDGTNLSSGLYFIHANVPDHLNQIQKVTLMK